MELRKLFTASELRKINSFIKDEREYFALCAACYKIAKGSEIPQNIAECLDPYGEYIETMKENLSDFTPEKCRDILLYIDMPCIKGNEISTPESISALAVRLLDIQPENELADLCCGSGAFLRDSLNSCTPAKLTGYEINRDRAAIAAMRCDILGIPNNIVCCDVFDAEGKFDRIFSNFPLHIRMKYFEETAIYREMKSVVPEMKIGCSGDWLFLYNIMMNLKNDGRAVGIITGGDTVNISDLAARRYFIESGYIEAVILLPVAMFESMMIPPVMVVLSHNNKRVRFIDASKLFVKGRRVNTLSDEHIETISSALENGASIARTADITEIAEHNYSLSPREYTFVPVEVKDAVTFGSVIKNITRGTQIKADELDRIASTKPTNDRFVRLADVQDGMLRSDLMYLKNIEKRYEKYLAPEHSIIMTKNGIPVRIAVTEKSEKERILVNGNMYVISLDEEKIDPYYLKAYLESVEGNKSLEGLMVGTNIPNLPLESLKKLEIPLLPMEQQKEIAENYRSCMKKINRLKKQLEEENSKRANVFADYVKSGK